MIQKSFLAAFGTLLIIIAFSACQRTGEKDSTDFINEMAKFGYELTAEEISDGDFFKESFYTNGCKISVFSDKNRKAYRLQLTFAGSSPTDFAGTAKSCIISFCSADEATAQRILDTLGLTVPPPDSTNGVARCESGCFLFYFTTDKAGGCLMIDNLRLNPTSAPTVTTRNAIARVESAEDTSSS